MRNLASQVAYSICTDGEEEFITFEVALNENLCS